MLKPYIIQKNDNSPEIILDQENNLFLISGTSVLENAHKIYEPILNWFKNYFKAPNKNTTLTLNLNYLNSSSSIFIMKLILIFEENDTNTNDLKIIWKYETEDELLRDRGIEFKKSTNINFILKEYKTSEFDDDFNFDI